MDALAALWLSQLQRGRLFAGLLEHAEEFVVGFHRMDLRSSWSGRASPDSRRRGHRRGLRLGSSSSAPATCLGFKCNAERSSTRFGRTALDEGTRPADPSPDAPGDDFRVASTRRTGDDRGGPSQPPGRRSGATRASQRRGAGKGQFPTRPRDAVSRGPPSTVCELRWGRLAGIPSINTSHVPD